MVLGSLVNGLVAIVTLVVCKYVYQVYYHPLGRFPGPKAAAVTHWYTTYYTYRGNVHLKLEDWHRRYGDTIRTGPRSISFNSPIASEQITAVRANTNKPDSYNSMQPSKNAINTISTSDKGVHRFRRGIQSQVFSRAGLQSVEARVLRHVDDFVEYLASGMDHEEHSQSVHPEGWGPPRYMPEVCNYMTYNLVTDLCYGQNADMFRSLENRWLPRAMTLLSRMVTTGMWQSDFNYYGFKALYLFTHRASFRNLKSWVVDASKTRAKQSHTDQTRDLYDAMMETADLKTGDHFTTKEVWNECFMVLIAGSDTTSTAMANTFFHLVHHSDVLASLNDEIRNRFAHVDEITPERVSGCKYLRACIDEAMRLNPPVVHGPLKEVASGGITVRGEFFEEGVILESPIYSLHRHPDYFESPNNYMPERWMVEEAAVQRLRKAFMPFSTGPHSCVGWRLAIMELTVALAKVVHRYDMRLAPDAPCCASTPLGSNCDPTMKGWMTSYCSGVSAQFRSREC